jgi:hypothetical protein
MVIQEQLIQEEEVVGQVVHQQELEDQEDQVLLLSELQDQQDLQQVLEQTQLQHYRHQLVVVKWLHSRFLEI